MLSPEAIARFQAKVLVSVPAISEIKAKQETAIATAKTLKAQAAELREKMKVADSEADGLRTEKKEYRFAIEQVASWKNQYNENKEQLVKAVKDDIEALKLNKEDGTAWGQLWRDIDASAREGLPVLSEDMWYAAEIGYARIEKVKAEIKAKAEEVEKLARQAWEKHAEAIAALKNAGLSADLIKDL